MPHRWAVCVMDRYFMGNLPMNIKQKLYSNIVLGYANKINGFCLCPERIFEKDIAGFGMFPTSQNRRVYGHRLCLLFSPSPVFLRPSVTTSLVAHRPETQPLAASDPAGIACYRRFHNSAELWTPKLSCAWVPSFFAKMSVVKWRAIYFCPTIPQKFLRGPLFFS